MSDIHERLARVEVLVSSTDEKLDQVLHALHGNGEPGMKVRVDRLEQAEKRRAKVIWAAITSAVGLATAALWKSFTGSNA